MVGSTVLVHENTGDRNSKETYVGHSEGVYMLLQ